MQIREAKESDIPLLIEVFQSAYAYMGHVPEDEFVFFERELKGSFDPKQAYRIQFFVIEEDLRIVSFAGIAPCLFMHGSWELRWDTTHPEYQRQGLMKKLLSHRIEYAISQNKGVPGVLQVAARQPTFYKNSGFKTVFERDIENYAMYLIKEI